MITARHLLFRLIGWLTSRDLQFLITETPLWYIAERIDRAGREAAHRKDWRWFG